MSRKQPSFAQLIDYIEAETKRKSQRFSIHHNTYSPDTASLKREFEENAQHLHKRKNGVYLYHEIISISRSQSLEEDQQKTILKHITESYIQARGRRNLAYAVLHEDTHNLHFHIVLSANEVGEASRTRLTKAQFADIQTRLEAWVLRHYPQLEQKAVFRKNQSQEERADRQDKRQHLSDKGEQMKRRGAKTDRREQVRERLTDIFERASNPSHFTQLLEHAGFTLYTRASTHGVTDREGNKYRLNRLGLAQAWQALDERMKAYLHEAKQGLHSARGKDESEQANFPPSEPSTQHGREQAIDAQSHQTDTQRAAKERAHPTLQNEAEKRLAQMQEIRAQRAQRKEQSRQRQQDRER